MQLLGSIIYLTSTFYRFVFSEVCLVHWTHSFFCIFIIQSLCFYFKMGSSIRNISNFYRKREWTARYIYDMIIMLGGFMLLFFYY